MKTPGSAPLALAIVLIAAASAPARAQQPAAKPAAAAPAPSPLLTALLQGITLTPVQRLKVDSILTSFRNQAPQLSPGTEPDSAMLRRFRELSHHALDGMRTVLTREQQEVWDRNLDQASAASMRVGP